MNTHNLPVAGPADLAIGDLLLRMPHVLLVWLFVSRAAITNYGTTAFLLSFQPFLAIALQRIPEPGAPAVSRSCPAFGVLKYAQDTLVGFGLRLSVADATICLHRIVRLELTPYATLPAVQQRCL